MVHQSHDDIYAESEGVQDIFHTETKLDLLASSRDKAKFKRMSDGLGLDWATKLSGDATDKDDAQSPDENRPVSGGSIVIEPKLLMLTKITCSQSRF